jgi:hypothetical protein
MFAFRCGGSVSVCSLFRDISTVGISLQLRYESCVIGRRDLSPACRRLEKLLPKSHHL